VLIASIYYWGQGEAVDYARAMAACKIGAEAGNATCQYQVANMYRKGQGVDVDHKQALVWFEKAAAQDEANAFGQLGNMYQMGHGVAPSFRRAREHYKRAIELGSSEAVQSMQIVAKFVQEVTSQQSDHSTPSPLVHDITWDYFKFYRTLFLSHAQHASLMDKRVENHGTSRADLNGKCGVATDFHIAEDRTNWRYTVKLDGGEAFKLKLANVRAEVAETGSGGGGAFMRKTQGKGKGKGKGKKGMGKGERK